MHFTTTPVQLEQLSHGMDGRVRGFGEGAGKVQKRVRKDWLRQAAGYASLVVAIMIFISFVSHIVAAIIHKPSLL
jgi:hypothetical protein